MTIPKIVKLDDREEIERFLRRAPGLHIYGIGDLDPPYWSNTRWFGLRVAGELRAVAFLYDGGGSPVLLALEAEPFTDASPAGRLLRHAGPLLPSEFYAHVSPHLHAALAESYEHESNGMHDKMVLTDETPSSEVDTTRTVPLTPDDAEEISKLFDEAYPGHWFDARMLDSGQYVGVREGTRLVAAGGVHVYAPGRGVAALGNVTTHPDFRRRGHSRAVVAAVTQSLLETVDLIGLNVHAENHGAIACYRELGFEKVGEHLEGMYSRRTEVRQNEPSRTTARAEDLTDIGPCGVEGRADARHRGSSSP